MPTGVAISGGGHRASLWGLGVLMYLRDVGRHTQVNSIASVSGGSITNGVIAHEINFRTSSDAEFVDAARRLVTIIAEEGLFFPGRATRWFTRGLITAAVTTLLALVAWLVLAVAAAVGVIGDIDLPGWIDQPLAVAVGPLVIALLVTLTLIVFAWRSRVVERALARTFFSREGAVTALADVHREGIEHVFCATELQSADHLYFAPRHVNSYRVGIGQPGGTTLATAVQCSACLPAAFRPRRLSTEDWGLQPFEGVTRPSAPPDRVVLADGGVYNNMADQWQSGMQRRLGRWPDTLPTPERSDELVVVNASGGWTWEPLTRWGLIRGELTGLLRPMSVMYDVTTSIRRAGLVGRFDRAELEPDRGDLRGALVHIPQSPRDTMERWARATGRWQQRADRAQQMLTRLDALGITAEEWDDIAQQNTAVATTLGPLGWEVTARLLHHAYVLAACNLHTILDHGEVDLPTPDELIARLQPGG